MIEIREMPKVGIERPEPLAESFKKVIVFVWQFEGNAVQSEKESKHRQRRKRKQQCTPSMVALQLQRVANPKTDYLKNHESNGLYRGIL
jgi:hypothetical protein